MAFEKQPFFWRFFRVRVFYSWRWLQLPLHRCSGRTEWWGNSKHAAWHDGSIVSIDCVKVLSHATTQLLKASFFRTWEFIQCDSLEIATLGSSCTETPGDCGWTIHRSQSSSGWHELFRSIVCNVAKLRAKGTLLRDFLHDMLWITEVHGPTSLEAPKIEIVNSFWNRAVNLRDTCLLWYSWPALPFSSHS